LAILIGKPVLLSREEQEEVELLRQPHGQVPGLSARLGRLEAKARGVVLAPAVLVAQPAPAAEVEA
jgi:hypothetical protein